MKYFIGKCRMITNFFYLRIRVPQHIEFMKLQVNITIP